MKSTHGDNFKGFVGEAHIGLLGIPVVVVGIVSVVVVGVVVVVVVVVVFVGVGVVVLVVVVVVVWVVVEEVTLHSGVGNHVPFFWHM